MDGIFTYLQERCQFLTSLLIVFLKCDDRRPSLYLRVMSQPAKKHRELVHKIRQLDRAYYEEAQPLVSDQEYDRALPRAAGSGSGASRAAHRRFAQPARGRRAASPLHLGRPCHPDAEPRQHLLRLGTGGVRRSHPKGAGGGEARLRDRAEDRRRRGEHSLREGQVRAGPDARRRAKGRRHHGEFAHDQATAARDQKPRSGARSARRGLLSAGRFYEIEPAARSRGRGDFCQSAQCRRRDAEAARFAAGGEAPAGHRALRAGRIARRRVRHAAGMAEADRESGPARAGENLVLPDRRQSCSRRWRNSISRARISPMRPTVRW